jgi:LysR family transcriptional regulator, glycine cleavage system transcriptional activator
MATALPPLNSLRAFEAAARLGGFARAAEELNVTPAAVSHQVKQLEAILGITLFERKARGLDLTEAGHQMLPDLTRGLSHMARAVGGLANEPVAGTLRLGIGPTPALMWLMPRLGRLLQQHPEIELTVNSAWPTPDPRSGITDIALFYGRGKYPGLVSELLMTEEVFPVCAPKVLARQPLRKPSDLLDHILIHDVDTNDDEPALKWDRWLRDLNVADAAPRGGLKFTNSGLVYQAALAGHGVALGRTALVSKHLRKGRLIRPFSQSRPADYAYYMVTTEADAKRPRINAIMEWLRAEAAFDSENAAAD